MNAFSQTNDRVVKALSITESQGMTLRDYFAAKAMQGILSGYTQGVIPPTESLAPASYKIADAMMEARNAAQ